jgi:hypothetical protein
LRSWFDKNDARLVAKGAVLAAIGSSFVLFVAGVAGLAYRVLMMAAGG